MNSRFIPIGVKINVEPEVANLVARTELQGVMSGSAAEYKSKILADDGITVESLARYFVLCAQTQACFAEAKRDGGYDFKKETGLSFSDPRKLYLPPLMATILANIGDAKEGNYTIEVHGSTFQSDTTFMWTISEALYRHQDILYCQNDQIGVANRNVDPGMMASIVVSLGTDHTVHTYSIDGSIDDRRAGLAALAGVTLVDTAQSLIYPFEASWYMADLARIVSVAKPTDTIQST